jgi:hypothetical protein
MDFALTTLARSGRGVRDPDVRGRDAAGYGTIARLPSTAIEAVRQLEMRVSSNGCFNPRRSPRLVCAGARLGIRCRARKSTHTRLELLANITTVTGGGGDLQAAAAMAGEALLPWVRQFDGYRGMLILADGESGTARFATFWEDEEALRRSEHGRAQVREQMAKTAGVEIESVQAYTVLLMDGF